jgi:hypothetical protein
VTRPVFLVAGLLAHEHDARARGAFTEYGLRGLQEQRAAATPGRRPAQTADGQPGRQK